MKSNATEKQLDIAKRVYPNAEVKRDNELYIVIEFTPHMDIFYGVFNTLEVIEKCFNSSIVPLRVCEKAYVPIQYMKCCGVIDNTYYVFKTKLNKKLK